MFAMDLPMLMLETLLDPKVLKVHKDSEDLRVLKDSKVHKDLKDSEDLKVLKV
jgi:hypothetical protein